MIYLIIGLCLLALVAMLAGWLRNRKLQKQLERGEITELPSIKDVEDMECCGQHETCEKDSLLAAVSKNVEYYNDEELDRFRGRTSDEYSEAETEEFREVLYTMKEVEVAGWVRDEVFLIVGERRMG